MNIETLLASDFSALMRRLADDGFGEQILSKLKRVERRRYVAVSAAGGAGAAIASSQFEALTDAIMRSAPALSDIAVNAGGLQFSSNLPAALLAATMFAIVAAATALIVPGSR